MTGYVGFDGSKVENQSGNYLALKIDTDPEDAVTTVEIVGGNKGPVTLDADKTHVCRITNKDTQKIKVVSKANGETVTKTYDLTGLVLESE